MERLFSLGRFYCFTWLLVSDVSFSWLINIQTIRRGSFTALVDKINVSHGFNLQIPRVFGDVDIEVMKVLSFKFSNTEVDVTPWLEAAFSLMF